MLPSRHRIKKNADFVRVISSGTKGKFGPFLFFYSPTGEKIRFGVVVSKKVAKLAVVRNWIRRVIQESLRNDPELLAQKTGDAVIMVLSLPQDDLRETIDKALSQWRKKLS